MKPYSVSLFWLPIWEMNPKPTEIEVGGGIWNYSIEELCWRFNFFSLWIACKSLMSGHLDINRGFPAQQIWEHSQVSPRFLQLWAPSSTLLHLSMNIYCSVSMALPLCCQNPFTPPRFSHIIFPVKSSLTPPKYVVFPLFQRQSEHPLSVLSIYCTFLCMSLSLRRLWAPWESMNLPLLISLSSSPGIK